MFPVAYLTIGVFLLLVGLITVGYFGYFWKHNGRNNVTIMGLSESLVTLFIGLFYVYCAAVLAHNFLTEEAETTTENDIVMMDEITTTTTLKPVITSTPEITTASKPVKINSTSEEFLKNYHNMFKNQPKRPREINTTTNHSEDCFTNTFVHSSMFLYSFLHCVLSLLVTSSENGQELAKSEETVTYKERCKFLSKLATTFLAPVLSVIILYFMLKTPAKSSDNLGKLFNNTGIDSSIMGILGKPLNISNPTNNPQINAVIQNVYKVLNSSKEQKIGTAPVKFNIDDHLHSQRKPKQVAECPESTTTLSRVSALVVFLCYFAAILFGKVKEAKLEACDRDSARQLNWSVASFAGLWLFGVLEMFAKVFLFETRDSLLTDVFLSLGNLNRVSIAALNYNSARNVVRKVRQVKPRESLQEEEK